VCPFKNVVEGVGGLGIGAGAGVEESRTECKTPSAIPRVVGSA
jgi:hypothetical protein